MDVGKLFVTGGSVSLHLTFRSFAVERVVTLRIGGSPRRPLLHGGGQQKI